MLADGETEADGETDGDALELGDRLDDGETDGLMLADGDTDADGDTLGDVLGDVLALGETLELGETDGDALDDGETEADGLTEALPAFWRFWRRMSVITSRYSQQIETGGHRVRYQRYDSTTADSQYDLTTSGIDSRDLIPPHRAATARGQHVALRLYRYMGNPERKTSRCEVLAQQQCDHVTRLLRGRDGWCGPRWTQSPTSATR